MDSTLPGARRHLAHLLTLLIVAAIALLGLVATSAPAVANTCTPNSTTACIQGTIKTSEGEGAEGVEITIRGEGDLASLPEQTTQTGADGRWAVAVEDSGQFTVTVNAETLPEGQYLRATDTRTVTTQLHTASSALFPLTDEPQGNGATTDDGATATPSPVPGPEVQAPEANGGGDFSWSRLWQQSASGLRMGLLLALGAVGLSLVYGTTGLSNFAHAEMLSMGGIFAYLFMQVTGNIWVTGVIVVALMLAVGWVQDAVLWKPLRVRRLSLIQMMIVSIGFSILLQNLFQFFFGANILRIDPSTPAVVTIAGVRLTVQSYVAMGIALALIIGVGIVMKYTRFGRAMRAVADNRPLAEASGIDVSRVIRAVWTVGVGLAGLSGMLFGLILNGIAWNTGWHFLLLLFAAVILGGIGTAFGAIVGSLLIGMTVELANIWLPGDLKHAAALGILIVVLLLRPQGLFGRRERIG